MGKKEKKDPDDDQKKEEPSEKKTNGDEKASKEKKEVKKVEKAEDNPAAKLASLQGIKGRCIVLPAFLLACAWLMLTSNPCKVKKRVDCGWAGVSALTCQTVACLNIVSMDLKEIVVQRKAGAKSGIKLETNRQTKFGKVQSVKGAVAEHNSQFPDQAIYVGDTIAKVDGQTGEKMKTALNNAALSTITIEVVRPRNGTLASYLPGAIQRMDNVVATALMSNSFERWAKFFGYIGGVGFFSWALSGYSAASLPLWYFGTAGVTSWYLTGCCFNDRPKKQGDPHCYMSGASDDFREILAQAWERSTRKYFESLLK